MAQVILRLVHVCIAYDCLFPWTVGGRRALVPQPGGAARRRRSRGHVPDAAAVGPGRSAADPGRAGRRRVAARTQLYGPDGNRAIGPPLRFGWGVLRHLLRHGRQYDVVHMASFPYFSVLAAAAARRRGGYRLVVDWHEVWSREYWRDYLGADRRRVGYAVQRRCVRVRQRAFCFSRLFQARLREEGLREPATVLEGEYAGSLEQPTPREADPLVVFAGPAHRGEAGAGGRRARSPAARARGLDVRGLILGDGPERPARAGGDRRARPGRHRRGARVRRQRGRRRRAAPRALPAAPVVARGLRARRRRGVGARDAGGRRRGPGQRRGRAGRAGRQRLRRGVGRRRRPRGRARRGQRGGLALRERTCAWFGENAERLSLARSLDVVAESYAGG